MRALLTRRARRDLERIDAWTRLNLGTRPLPVRPMRRRPEPTRARRIARPSPTKRVGADGARRRSSRLTDFVDNIEYDEKGRRTLIEYENGTQTSYSYDELTFRLTYFQTKRLGDNKLLQSLEYTYDPVGNITSTRDTASQDVYFSATTIESADGDYTYDALYRLIAAEGREHAAGADVQLDADDRPIHDVPHPNDPSGLRLFTRAYTFDAIGNILSLAHTAVGNSSASWTREYTYASSPSSNRLVSTTHGTLGTQSYTHDAHGNMTVMPHLDALDWDYADRLQHCDLGGGGDVYFVYDGSGERVRKVYVHGTTVEERIYLGGYEVYRKSVSSTLDEERQTVHIADDQRRVCMVETKTVSGGSTVSSPTPRQRFQLDDHLGTVGVEVDDSAAVISREEYHPLGTSAFRAWKSGVEVSAKRYRYTGKERDEETGLGYHGARYYACWLGRWTAADPLAVDRSKRPNVNRYEYVRGRPTIALDPDGRDYRLQIDGSKIVVKVEIVVSLVGEGTAADARAIKAANEKYFRPTEFKKDGKKYDVSFEFDVKVQTLKPPERLAPGMLPHDAPGAVPQAGQRRPQNLIEVRPLRPAESAGNEHGRAAAITIKPGVDASASRHLGTWPREEIQKQAPIAHETGHLLGVPDDPESDPVEVRTVGGPPVSLMNLFITDARSSKLETAQLQGRHVAQIVGAGLALHEQKISELRAQASAAEKRKERAAAGALRSVATQLEREDEVFVPAK